MNQRDDGQQCEYFLKHARSGLGDDNVFYFFGTLMCDRNSSLQSPGSNSCAYGNNGCERFSLEGEGPTFGLCLSRGQRGKESVLATAQV